MHSLVPVYKRRILISRGYQSNFLRSSQDCARAQRRYIAFLILNKLHHMIQFRAVPVFAVPPVLVRRPGARSPVLGLSDLKPPNTLVQKAPLCLQ